MKILWFLIISSLLAISCSNDGQVSKEKQSASEAKHEHKEAVARLELNNGAKWKADSSTNSNVKNLQAIVDKFRAGTDKSVDDYHSAATELQAGLDKMIAECKMKGADHDALHKWLEPLLGNVSRLKKSANELEAADIMKETDAHLKSYAQYFE